MMRPRHPRYPDAPRIPTLAEAGSVWWLRLGNGLAFVAVMLVAGVTGWLW